MWVQGRRRMVDARGPRAIQALDTGCGWSTVRLPGTTSMWSSPPQVASFVVSGRSLHLTATSTTAL